MNNNIENLSSFSIQKRAMVAILLPLSLLLSSCAFFEDPVYNRYGKRFDATDYAQEPYTEKQITKPVEIEPAIAEKVQAETVQVELPAEIVAAPIAIVAEPAIESAPAAVAVVAETSQENTGNYSIQLYGAYDKVFSQKYIEYQQLEYVTTIRELKHKGRPWFVVLYGSYNTYEEATQARKGLSSTLLSHGPWVRFLGQKQPAVLPAFSIQLMASQSRDVAVNMMSRYNIASQAYIHETTINGLSWYLVLYGKYQFSEDAHKEIPNLPRRLQKLGAWVRSLK